jgi:CYTH domain-containing protein
VTAPVDRGLDDETGEPKYARMELERRWLIDAGRRPPLDGCHSTLIEDRYIDATRMRLRRMSRPGWDKTKWKLTKKYDCVEARARPIVSTYLTQREYDLYRTLPAHELVKRRYHLEVDGRWWSVDVFEGGLAGLELIECEADDLAALDGLAPPDWALREVTDLPQGQGGALAGAQAIPES